MLRRSLVSYSRSDLAKPQIKKHRLDSHPHVAACLWHATHGLPCNTLQNQGKSHNRLPKTLGACQRHAATFYGHISTASSHQHANKKILRRSAVRHAGGFADYAAVIDCLFHGNLLHLAALADNVDAVGEVAPVGTHHLAVEVVDLVRQRTVNLTGCIADYNIIHAGAYIEFDNGGCDVVIHGVHADFHVGGFSVAICLDFLVIGGLRLHYGYQALVGYLHDVGVGRYIEEMRQSGFGRNDSRFDLECVAGLGACQQHILYSHLGNGSLLADGTFIIETIPARGCVFIEGYRAWHHIEGHTVVAERGVLGRGRCHGGYIDACHIVHLGESIGAD